MRFHNSDTLIIEAEDVEIPKDAKMHEILYLYFEERTTEFKLNGGSFLNIKTANISRHVSFIGNEVFSDSTLQTIIFEPRTNIDKELIIAPYAFLLCKKLKSVKLPFGISIINKNLFENCTSLKKIIIPETVQKIDDHAFYYCISLMYIYYQKRLNNTPLIIGKFSFTKTNIKQLKIPNFITEIRCWAFYESNIEFINFVDRNYKSILIIEQFAFYCCHKLKLLYIPAFINCINYSSFKECINLISIIFEKRSDDNKLIIKKEAFLRCSNLTNLEILSNIIVENYSFEFCFRIKNLIMPPNIGWSRNIFCWDAINQYHKAYHNKKRRIELLTYLALSKQYIKKSQKNIKNPIEIIIKNVIFWMQISKFI